MLSPFTVRVQRNYATQSFTLYVWESRFPQHEPGEELSPLGYLVDQEAQRLMDDLYAAGVRPTEGRVTDEVKKAMEANLSDLRGILKDVLPAALKPPLVWHVDT